MASCSFCGSTIVFGGKKDGALRFCNATCQEKGVLIRLAEQVPHEAVEEAVRATHSGSCPVCQGRGPVDVHTSHQVISFLVMTRWSSHPRLSCRSCGCKAKLGNALLSLLLGWWGFPWGLILTPVQVGRNLIGLAAGSQTDKPSEQLRRMIRIRLAAEALQNQPQTHAAASQR
jgi:hypothetical protein